jgi:hypothetical protein
VRVFADTCLVPSMVMLPLASTATAKCTSGALAGPCKTVPLLSNLLPWHGQYSVSAEGATSQPWCVQVIVMAYKPLESRPRMAGASGTTLKEPTLVLLTLPADTTPNEAAAPEPPEHATKGLAAKIFRNERRRFCMLFLGLEN